MLKKLVYKVNKSSHTPTYLVYNINKLGTYQVQTMKISIYAIRSTSKGRGVGGGMGDWQKYDYPIQEWVQIVKLPNPSCLHAPWILIR